MRTDAHSAAAPTRFVAGETPCVCCAERAAREGECGIYCCTCAKLNGGACCEAAVAEEAAREADGRDTGLYCDDCGKTLTRHEGVEGALEAAGGSRSGTVGIAERWCRPKRLGAWLLH